MIRQRPRQLRRALRHVAAMAAIAAAAPALAGDAVGRVLAGLAADRADVRACLAEQVAASAERAGEVGRLGDVLDWIDAPKPARDQQAFRDIVAGFNHERRYDAGLLATLTGNRLTPRHVSTWARVQRALAAGHDPRRILCGT